MNSVVMRILALLAWCGVSVAWGAPEPGSDGSNVAFDTSLALSAVMIGGQADADIAAADTPEGLLPLLDYDGDIGSRGALSGNWGGARDDLAAQGVSFDLRWTQVMQAVVEGGTDTGFKYGGSMDLFVQFDLQRMGIIPGGLVKLRAESRYGESVNDLSGLLLPVNTDGFFPLTSEPDENIPITITQFSYTQFFSPRFAVFGGKIDTLDGDLNEFASGRGRTQFLNANFIFNAVTAVTVPYSALAGGIVVVPLDWLSISSALLTTKDSSTTTGFDNLGDGWTWSTEIQAKYTLGELPGGQTLGIIYAFDSDFTEIRGGRLELPPDGGIAFSSRDDSWAVTWNGWQYLTIEDPTRHPINLLDGRPDHQGVGLFARAGVADKSTNPIEFSVSGGVGGRGVIPSRDADLFGVGFFYNEIAEPRLFTLLGLSGETLGVEAFYDFALTPAAHVTLDLQVAEPVASGLDTEVILGLRAHLQF